MTTLVVTNDFPPRVGGIETYLRHVCSFLGNDVVVLTRTERDGFATRSYDASLPFPVHRLPGPLLPTAALARRAVELMRSYAADQVVFGAAAPLGAKARSGSSLSATAMRCGGPGCRAREARCAASGETWMPSA